MERRPRIWTEMRPLGNRMTCTPALRPSSSSSTCAAGMPRRSSALTVETALAVISFGGAAAGEDARGWAHPSHPTPAAKSMTPREVREPRVTALVPGVLLQASDGRFTRRDRVQRVPRDRKSTRLNSSHRTISYAVFCLKNKKKNIKKKKKKKNIKK